MALLPPEDNRPTDADVVEAFLATRSASTGRVYRNTLAQWAAQCPEGGYAAATFDHALAWWKAQEPTRRAKTRARTLHTLRTFYRFGQHYAQWPRNPWATIAPPDVEDRPPRQVLKPTEIARLFEAAQGDPRAYVCVSLLLTTGLRVGELAAARWQDVRRSDDNQYGLAVAGAHERVVKLVPPVWAAVCRYRESLGLPTALDGGDTRPLVWGRHGRPIQPQTITSLIAQVAQQAELTTESRVTAVWLRNAHAVWARQGGASVVQIQEGLGLRQRRSVDRYLGATPALGETSADAVWKVFGGTPPRPKGGE